MDNLSISILESLTSQSGGGNIADALFAISHSLDRVAIAIERLGVNDAATSMGAIEILSLKIKNGFEQLADSMEIQSGKNNME